MMDAERMVIQSFATAAAAAIREQQVKKLGAPLGEWLNNPGCMTRWRDPDGELMPTADGLVSFEDDYVGWNAWRAQCRINLMKRQLSITGFFCGGPDYPGYRSPAITNPEELAHTVAGLMSRDLGVIVAPQHTLSVISRAYLGRPDRGSLMASAPYGE